MQSCVTAVAKVQSNSRDRRMQSKCNLKLVVVGSNQRQDREALHHRPHCNCCRIKLKTREKEAIASLVHPHHYCCWTKIKTRTGSIAWFWMTHGDWNDDEFDDSDFSLSLLIERQRMWKCARVALCELQWVQSSVKKIQSKSFVGSVQWQLGRRKNSLSLILITVVLKFSWIMLWFKRDENYFQTEWGSYDE